MKKLLTLAAILITSFSALAQNEIQYREYSYTEFFQMIEDEEDSIFQLENALIFPKYPQDSSFTFEIDVISVIQSEYMLDGIEAKDSIYVDKEIQLSNVNFSMGQPAFIDGKIKLAALSFISFKRKVNLLNVPNFAITSSTFHDALIMNYNTQINSNKNNRVKQVFEDNSITLEKSVLKKGITFNSTSGSVADIQFNIGGCDIYPQPASDFFTELRNIHSDFNINKTQNFYFHGNRLVGSGDVSFYIRNPVELEIANNTFENDLTIIALKDLPDADIRIKLNKFGKYVGLDFTGVSQNAVLGWKQLEGKIFSMKSLVHRTETITPNNSEITATDKNIYNTTILDYFTQTTIVQNLSDYKEEQRVKGQLMKYYRDQNDIDYANRVFIESKNLETKRLAYLYEKDPHFNTFFKWKINQFLKIFSAYGTEPAKAITMSVYVVLVFALVYLFFPNHWDSHGKDRILHRYQFFFKYLNKDAGMHDIYLDGKKDELTHYDGFKNFFIENGKTVPKFFLATALPLYRWSTASTRSSSWLLRKIDIFKGKWSDLPAAQRAAKTVLLSLAFAVAILYDIFIKILNALMLSINTFTTLGFGEIPIKGLPRYLAIIQGFIGWFMLTIFSVSLISQLLN